MIKSIVASLCVNREWLSTKSNAHCDAYLFIVNNAVTQMGVLPKCVQNDFQPAILFFLYIFISSLKIYND